MGWSVAARLSSQRQTRRRVSGPDQPLDLTRRRTPPGPSPIAERSLYIAASPIFACPVSTHYERQQLEGSDWSAFDRAFGDVRAAVTPAGRGRLSRPLRIGVGALVLGQDLRAGYTGKDGVHYQLHLTEGFVLRIDEPRAICTRFRPRRAGCAPARPKPHAELRGRNAFEIAQCRSTGHLR